MTDFGPAPRGARHRARWRWVAGGAAALLACLALGAAAEKAARTFPEVMLPQFKIKHFVYASAATFKVKPDRDVGFVMRPDQHVDLRTDDYTYLMETDGNGLPNREPWPAHPELVFLGDSLVVGPGVGLDGSFPSLAAHDVGLSFVNLGVPGAGPERQYALYRRFGADLTPRLVVACLFLAADFDNDIHFRAWERDAQAPTTIDSGSTSSTRGRRASGRFSASTSTDPGCTAWARN